MYVYMCVYQMGMEMRTMRVELIKKKGATNKFILRKCMN